MAAMIVVGGASGEVLRALARSWWRLSFDPTPACACLSDFMAGEIERGRMSRLHSLSCGPLHGISIDNIINSMNDHVTTRFFCIDTFDPL